METPEEKAARIRNSISAKHGQQNLKNSQHLQKQVDENNARRQRAYANIAKNAGNVGSWSPIRTAVSYANNKRDRSGIRRAYQQRIGNMLRDDGLVMSTGRAIRDYIPEPVTPQVEQLKQEKSKETPISNPGLDAFQPGRQINESGKNTLRQQ